MDVTKEPFMDVSTAATSDCGDILETDSQEKRNFKNVSKSNNIEALSNVIVMDTIDEHETEADTQPVLDNDDNESAIIHQPSTSLLLSTSSSSSPVKRYNSVHSRATESFKTIKSIATRIKVANQLSIAKRTQQQDDISISPACLQFNETSFKKPNTSGMNINTSTTLTMATNLNKNKSSNIAEPIMYTSSMFYDKPSLANFLPSTSSLNSKECIISGGNLIFDNDFKSKIKKRPYIHVMPDSEPDNCAQIMNVFINEWKLPLPRIAIFVLSHVGDLEFWNNQRQIDAFKKGLIKALKTTTAWLVTNGLHIGAAKLIGEAIEEDERQTFEHRKSNFNVIGLPCVRNVAYPSDFFGDEICLSRTAADSSENRYELNQQHSHFVLLNSDSPYGSYLQLELMDYLAKNQSRQQKQIANSTLKQAQISQYHPSSSQKCQSTPTSGPNGTAIATTTATAATAGQLPKYSEILAGTRHQLKRTVSNAQISHLVDQHQLGDTDTVDFLTTPDTSGAPAPTPSELVSRQFSIRTGITQIDATTMHFEEQCIHSDNDSSLNFVADSDAIQPEIVNEPARVILEKISVPISCLVIQGDYESARIVLDTLRRRNPVIVLRGSGGFADMLSFAYLSLQQRFRDIYNAWDAEFVENILKPILGEEIVKSFPHLRNNTMARNMFRDRIVECVRESTLPKGRVLLTVLTMDNSASCNLEKLPEYILLSLKKSQNRSFDSNLDINLIRKDLYLTIDWNCPSIAQHLLHKNPTFFDLKLLFEIALLREEREDFVDLFLQHGFQIHKYLTPFRLKKLVRYSLCECEFFRNVCMENILGIAVWSVNFEELIENLEQTPSQSREADSFITNELNHLIFICSSLRDFISVQDLYLNIMGLFPINVQASERKSLSILAMWAVFNRRFKLAEVLWKFSDQPIHLGLILSLMCKRLELFLVNPDQNLKEELIKSAKRFSQFSVGVLNDAATYYHDGAVFKLLNQENSDWAQKTASDLAREAHETHFFSQVAVQKFLTSLFMGHIRIRELSYGFITVPIEIKIILSAFLIFPMYIWIRFVDDPSNPYQAWHEKMKDHYPEEAELSESEEDKFLNDIKMKEFKKQDHSNNQQDKDRQEEHWKSTLNLIKCHSKNQRDTFKQRYLFIKRQPPIWTMIYLMWNSPITKFWTYQIFYMIYLALFSLAVVWPGCGYWPLDTIVCLWTALIFFERIQLTRIMFQKYSSVSTIKTLELLGMLLLLILYTFGRVFYFPAMEFEKLFSPYSMKVILSFGLLYSYYRLFGDYLPVSPTLGPLLYRFRYMCIYDFVHFMRMALILLISSGIVIQSILYPNTELSIDTFHKGFHRSAISLFLTPVDELTIKCKRNQSIENSILLKGQTNSTQNQMMHSKTSNLWHNPLMDIKNFVGESLSLNQPKADYCPAKPISMLESCPQTGFWAYFFTFQFLIILKLILLTLLYALFAATASRLQTETDNIWKFQRYSLVVNFASRSPLTAPLNVFLYLWRIIQTILQILTCKFFYKKNNDTTDSKQLPNIDADSENEARLSQEDYNYWKYLAKKFYEQQKKKDDKTDPSVKQFESIQMLSEEVENTKSLLLTMKTKLYEIEKTINRGQINLEGLKFSRCGFKKELSDKILPGLQFPLTFNSSEIHHLSRHSPYVGTRISRFPIAEKWVVWDVNWINYDPVIYSRRREDFPINLKPFVDEDVLAIKEKRYSVAKFDSTSDHFCNFHLPIFNWNAVSINPAGLTIDRQSWIVKQQTNTNLIYKLDEGIPLNPFGRTGLRGKGNLPRWGPNHYIMIILTKSLQNSSTFEIALELKTNMLSIPMRFVGDDKIFREIQTLFSAKDSSLEWNNENDMLAFFQSSLPQNNVKMDKPITFYMDSPDNTDNAWKEVKVYHIHLDTDQLYDDIFSNINTTETSFSAAFPTQKSLFWFLSSEDLLVRLPMEQVSFMNSVIRNISESKQTFQKNDI